MSEVSRETVERLLAAGGARSLDGRDLAGLDLSGLRLDGVDLSYAILERATLAGASLRRAFLWSVRAAGANFAGCDLREARLGTADVSGADFRGADLRGADLLGTNLSLADLRGADLRDTDPAGAILTRTLTDAATRWPGGGAPRDNPAASDVALGPADTGRRVAVRPGDTVTLRLPENPTTGYRWEVAADSSAALGAVASLIHRGFAAPAGDAAGAAGERILVIEAKQPGRAAVRLVCRPAWRDDAAAAGEFAFELVVAP